ncbi:MAG: MoxR family ATPase [Clostridia bacterium]|nr:MoxR family ATPase [Clostridia bacterium]
METQDKAIAILENMKTVIIDKDHVLKKVLICFFARGHILIEDVPGVGKTTLVKALSKSVDLSHSRIQFTPDLMPADITGLTVYNRDKNQFEFKMGPLFNQIILADEINRTSPKTQSSLLQAMEELQVSVDNHTYDLEQPFMVLATQNPMDYQGTYPLPEAQLDRFIMKVSLGYPSPPSEKIIVENYRQSKSLDHLHAVASKDDILKIQEEVDHVLLHPDILSYIVAITNASRHHPSIHLGASPRVSIDLFRSVKALAYLEGRNYVLPDDVKKIVPDILCHRLILSAEARIEGKKIESVIDGILNTVSVPVVMPYEK